MRVLLVNKFLYPKGGDAVSTLFTGEMLRRRGHAVSYWGMADDRNATFAHEELLVPHVDYHVRSDLWGTAHDALNILYSREAKILFRKMVERVKPDIVHLHNFAHQISPSILHVLRDLGIPAVMTMHDYKLVCPVYTLLSGGELCERCSQGRYYHCILRKCTMGSGLKSLVNAMEMYLHHTILGIYKSISCFISPSAFLADKVVQMGFSGKIVHIPNALNVAEFRPAVHEAEGEFIYFGRLSREKGVRTLIRAVMDSNDLFLKIVGDGPERASLEDMVRAASCDRIRFLGYLRGEQLHDEIRSALAVVVPSEWYENCPMSILEAFALGKTVVGARIGGIPELIRNGIDGLTFMSGDQIDLREKLSTIVQNRVQCKAMGVEGRLKLERDYSSERYCDGLEAVYSDVIAGRDR